MVKRQRFIAEKKTTTLEFYMFQLNNSPFGQRKIQENFKTYREKRK